MYSDGYITKANLYTNYMGIAVAEKDKEWLEKFKEFLNYNGDIKHYKTAEGSYKVNSPYVRLLIGNNKIVEDLEKHGVLEHKTHKLNVLPNTNFLDDFIRGYIDGDGSLRKTRPDLRICGTKSFLTNIAQYLQLPYRMYEDKTIYSLVYNTSSAYLEKRLYKDAKYSRDSKGEFYKCWN